MIDPYIIDAVCQKLHKARQEGKGRKPEWIHLDYTALPEEAKDKYRLQARPVLQALMRAGFVPIQESEVRKAYVPRKEITPVRRVLNITEKGAKVI